MPVEYACPSWEQEQGATREARRNLAPYLPARTLSASEIRDIRRLYRCIPRPPGREELDLCREFLGIMARFREKENVDPATLRELRVRWRCSSVPCVTTSEFEAGQSQLVVCRRNREAGWFRAVSDFLRAGQRHEVHDPTTRRCGGAFVSRFEGTPRGGASLRLVFSMLVFPAPARDRLQTTRPDGRIHANGTAENPASMFAPFCASVQAPTMKGSVQRCSQESPEAAAV